ncbi:MAG: hypothetical protein JSU70_16665 [Phycisphaerales bacterium]|nr:MAG: hypothetical protein JSU70_16665 [Phycisphaerales bacterium]
MDEAMGIATHLVSATTHWQFTGQMGLTFWVSVILCVFATGGTTHGGGRYFKYDHPGSTIPAELPTPVTGTLWILDGVPRLRGIIVHRHGAGTAASVEGSTTGNDGAVQQAEAVFDKLDGAVEADRDRLRHSGGCEGQHGHGRGCN